MEMWHPNILQTHLFSKLLPSSSQPRKQRQKSQACWSPTSTPWSPAKPNPVDKLDFRATHNPTPLQVFTARLSDKRNNFSISQWHVREMAVTGSELGGFGLHGERPRQAYSLSEALKRACCSKGTSPRGLDNKTLAWFAIPSWGASSGFSVMLHHQRKVLVTCSVQSLGTSRWFGRAAP